MKFAKKISLAVLLLILLGFASFAMFKIIPALKTPTPTLREISPKDTSNITMTPKTMGDITFFYEEGEWILQENAPDTSLILMYAETAATQEACNVTIDKIPVGDYQINESYMNNIITNMRHSYKGYITVNNYEICTINGVRIIYMENTIKFTDKSIDNMIKRGSLTEKDIEAMGGREFLLEIPETTQVAFYAEINDELYMFTGTYYNEKEKQIVIENIATLVDTAKVQIKT